MRIMGHHLDRRYILAAVQLISPFIAIWALMQYATFPWICVALVMFFLMRVVGGAITYHRIHSHRTHVMHPIVEFICTALGFYASFVSPVEFAAAHNNHHKYSDTDKDPHPYMKMGWKVLFPILWNDSGPNSGDVRTAVRLRRNKVTNLFYQRFWIMAALPFLLLLISVEAFFFIYFIPFTLALWSAAFAVFNHDENGPKSMKGWYGILTGEGHAHKWHHDHPYDTSGESWINTIANIIATKKVKT